MEETTLGQRIKTVRIKANLTQAKFADQIGLKRNSLAIVEIDGRPLSEIRLKEICRLFDVDYFWLTEGKGTMESEKDTSVLMALKLEYDLSDLDCQVLDNFLALGSEDRDTLIKLVKNIVIAK